MNLGRRIHSFLGILVIFVLLPGLVMAQTGKVRGTVVDSETGEPLMGANVIIEGSSMGSATGMNGEYFILNVPPGNYKLVATYMGYQKMTISNVIVTIGLTTFQDFNMPKMVLEGQEVVIVAERPLVDKNATNDVKVIRKEDIENIPIRGYQNVVGAQAGAVQSGADIYVRGGRADEVAYYVDGVLMNNPYDRDRTGNVSDAAVEDINYQPGGMDGSFGGFNAGVVSTSTRTGGSDYTISAEAVTDKFMKETGDSKGSYSYGYELYNISAGGPVPMTNNKLRFFANAEYHWMADRRPTYAPTVEPDVFTANLQDLIDLGPLPQAVYGQKKNNWMESWTGTANLSWALENFKIKLGGHMHMSDWQDYIHSYAPFNSGHNPLYTRDTYTGYLRGTWIVSPTAFIEANVNYYHTEYERFDPIHKTNYLDYTDPSKNVNVNDWGQRATQSDELAKFDAYGRVFGTHNMEQNDRYAIKLDGTWQINQANEIGAGFEAQFNNVRFYNVQPWRVSSNMHAFYENNGQYPTGDDLAGVYRNSYADNAGYDITGQNKVDTGRDEPRKPKIYSGYIKDKIEFKDLVVNLSMRLDHIIIDQQTINDEYNIELTEEGLIDDSNLGESEVYTEFSPRLGFAFPVTDRTVFHLQYGKYVEPPPFDRTYITWQLLAANLQQGNFTTSSNPGLKPVKTTSYEVGFEQQLGSSASLDITAFYKEIVDQIQLRALQGASPSVYSRFENGDFGNVKGFSFDFQLRRTHRVMANINYTLQWANGTGSDPNTQYNIAWQNPGEYPTFVAPLDYDQRNTATVNVDFRTLPEDGPQLMGHHIFGNVGLNLFYTYGSGLAYTPETVTSSSLYGSGGSLFPAAAINSGHRPATSNLNLRLDKKFTVGAFTLNPYLWVINLFNTENVRNVYGATGLPNDDGWFNTLEGQVWAQNNPVAYEWYKFRVQDPEDYESPRQIRVGLRIDYK